MSKPPRRSINSLIRDAISKRYDMKASVSKSGNVTTPYMSFAPVADWWTTRTDAGCIRLYQRHILMFTFSPEN